MEPLDYEEKEYNRYFAKDAVGNDLFYITLIDFGADKYFVDTSLTYSILQKEEVKKLCDIIALKSTIESTRIHFIEKLFALIKNLPEARLCYFKLYHLDKYGRFNESQYNSIRSLYADSKLNFLEPYSSSHNSLMFFAAKDNDVQDATVPLCKEEFEDKVGLSWSLQIAYVEVYSENETEYIAEEIVIDDYSAFVYYMVINKELVFFFLFHF